MGSGSQRFKAILKEDLNEYFNAGMKVYVIAGKDIEVVSLCGRIQINLAMIDANKNKFDWILGNPFNLIEEGKTCQM